jgi:uncharacterized protein (DUF58 family)
MAFPDAGHRTPGVPDKWSVARAIAIGLASVAHASGDPVGAMCTSSDGTRKFMPRTRRGTISELTRTLDGAGAGGSDSIAPLLAPLSSGARIVIITDFLGDVDSLLRTAAPLVASGATVECVHIVAAEELAPPLPAGLARDPEAPDVERAFDRHALVAYRTAFDAFRSDVARRTRAMGARYTEARTDAPLPRLIRQIVGGQGP